MSQLYLVTGAAGFLGGTICRQLVQEGNAVRAFVLPNDPAMKFVPAECEICEGDLTDKASVERFFNVPEGTEFNVIHCASIVTVDETYNQKVIDVNVGGTQNIVDCCLSTPGFQKLVYVSSTGAIPELPKGKRIREVSAFYPEATPELVRGCYSFSKAKGSQVVLDAVHNRGLNASIVHPSGILGPEDYAMGETSRILVDIINGSLPAAIDGSFNLCDVRDLAAGTIAAVEKGRSGECYILGNEEISFREFAQLLVEESNCKPIKQFLPCKMANLLGKGMEFASKFTHKPPMMTTFSVYNLARNNDFDSTKAFNELGYTTRSYRETMQDEIAWLKSTGKIAAC